MFNWEELSQTVDKSEQGRPDRAGQPLEAVAEGQVSQLLLCSAQGGDTPPSALGQGLELRSGVKGDHASRQSAHLALRPP